MWKDDVRRTSHYDRFVCRATVSNGDACTIIICLLVTHNPHALQLFCWQQSPDYGTRVAYGTIVSTTSITI